MPERSPSLDGLGQLASSPLDADPEGSTFGALCRREAW
jgi:hypothetical protein